MAAIGCGVIESALLSGFTFAELIAYAVCLT